MTIVDTEHGRIRGSNEDRLVVFRGIPYAAAPVGDLRWEAPRPPAPWDGVRDALAFGPVSPQERIPEAGPIMAIEQPESEDCLYLNVWTPGTDAARRSVLFWIHGGGFYMGAGSQGVYDGKHLASRDVVVVTVNYRMGPFGFVHLKTPTNGEIPASGNEGLLDQIAALEWVHHNIERFGGDPDNVTIFGESAGGMNVASLLTMPRAAGLFHKAVVHSGPGHTNFSVNEAVEWIAEPMLAALGTREAAALRNASTQDLQKAIPSLLAAVTNPDVTKANGWAIMMWSPIGRSTPSRRASKRGYRS